MENNPEEKQSPYDKAVEKFNSLGFFSLTAEDHKAMGSSPDKILKENPGKAAYEVMDQEEISTLIDAAFDSLWDKNSIKNGYSEYCRGFLVTSLPFLKSVGKLPEKFKDFDLKTLSVT